MLKHRVSSGSEVILQNDAPRKQLSSFIPTKDNVVGETNDELTVLLSPGDVGAPSRIGAIASKA